MFVLSTFTSTSSTSEVLMLQDKIQQNADNYVDEIYNSTKKKKQYIQDMATSMEKLHELGNFTLPLTMISTSIKRILRAKIFPDGTKLSEYQVHYVSEVLEDKYKDPKFDTFDFQGVENNASSVGNDNDSVIDDFQDQAKQRIALDKLSRLSSAEKYEYLNRRLNMIAEYKKIYNDEKSSLEEFANREGIKIPANSKTSAELPPEHFHGWSKLYELLRQVEEKKKWSYEYTKDVADLVYAFKPPQDIDEKATQYLEKYIEQMVIMEKVELYYLQGFNEIMNYVADRKHRASLGTWFKIGVDQIFNYGSHGAGVKNAVLTGEVVAKIGKDGKSVLKVPMEKELTREQVGANTLGGKLIKTARDIIMEHNIQLFIDEISKTEFVEKIGDPYEFYNEWQRSKVPK